MPPKPKEVSQTKRKTPTVKIKLLDVTCGVQLDFSEPMDFDYMGDPTKVLVVWIEPSNSEPRSLAGNSTVVSNTTDDGVEFEWRAEIKSDT
jgi:hypothetical protein